MDASYIKTLMERENITQAELARLTDIPQGTLSRILNGTTDCPTFANVTAIVKALHGSLDVMAGIVDEPNDKPMTMTERELYEKLIADKERQLRSIKRHIGTEATMDAEAVATADRDDSSCRRDAGA